MAGSFFNCRRNTLLSIIYYLQTQLDLIWTNDSAVSVVKSFAEVEESDLPVIAVDLILTEHEAVEIGDTSLKDTYSIVFNFFTDSDSFTLDLVDFCVDKLRTGFTYYEHSLTNNAYVRAANGRVSMVRVELDDKVEFDETSHEKEQHRHELIIMFRKDTAA